MDAIKRLFSSSGNESDERIAELEEKYAKIKESLAATKAQLAGYTECRAERDLYHVLMSVIASHQTFETLLNALAEKLAELLNARYAGVFILDAESDALTLTGNRGYIEDRLPEITRKQSLMGQCLKSRSIIWEPDFRAKSDFFVNFNQNPAEYNLLLIPVFVFNAETAVVRLANIDEKGEVIAAAVMRDIVPMISSQIERLQLVHRSEQSLKSLDATFSIAKLLENTLNDADILRNLCAKVPRLIPCKACIIATLGDDGSVQPAVTWPNGFHLGGNPQSEQIYLRNLIQTWPDGTTVIPDIRRDRRWSWAVADIRSLCMAPLRIRNVLRGVIISLGPREEPYDDNLARFVGLAASQASVTLERAAYFRRQEELASCDGLTGLLNHRVFQETVRSEIDRAQRYNRPLTLLLFDIDHFKKFNDTYGHPVGDEVIKMVARTAKGASRTTDKVFRYGGEEFCVLLPETPIDNGAILAERIRAHVEKDRSIKGLSVTISLGVTQFHPGEGPEAFIDRADNGMYRSKEGGRNRFTVAA